MKSNTFDPQILAGDFLEVRRIYAEFFAALDETRWDKPVKGSPGEWDLHETVAHLVALNGAGLESVKCALLGEQYTFVGLEDRHKFDAYNRKGIDDRLILPRNELCAKLLDILDQSSRIARDLTPDQAELTLQMAIYNRPVKIIEALSIIVFHTGLTHSAQVADPAGHLPLWMQLSPEIRHRMIGRNIRALSLLYRMDIGGSLRERLVFRIDGGGGGEWYVELSPEAPMSGEGAIENPGLVIHLRETDVFCQMMTGRLKLPLALLRGDMKLSGDLRLFLRMSTLFDWNARPKFEGKNPSFQQHLTGSPS